MRSINLNNVRIYDNRGKTVDRYTALYMSLPENLSKNLYSARGMCQNPTSPQGFGCWTSAQPGKHLGFRIKFEDLPKACQDLIISDLEEIL